MEEHSIFQGAALVWNGCQDCGGLKGGSQGVAGEQNGQITKEHICHEKEGELYLVSVGEP